jgi:hypothetical protein
MADEATKQVCVWPDGTWCYTDELNEMASFMSDDYELISEVELARRGI